MTMTLTKYEETELKKEVKMVTGLKLKDIHIYAFGERTIKYWFYANNYDKVRNVKTYDMIERTKRA